MRGSIYYRFAAAEVAKRPYTWLEHREYPLKRGTVVSHLSVVSEVSTPSQGDGIGVMRRVRGHGAQRRKPTRAKALGQHKSFHGS